MQGGREPWGRRDGEDDAELPGRVDGLARRAAPRSRGCLVACLLPALAGMVLGGWLRARARPETFRLGFFVGLLLLGSELVWRGLA